MAFKEISLPWGQGALSCRIPENNLGEVLSPNARPPLGGLDAAIANALDAPIGLAPMSEWVKPGYKVLLISDDNTRLTPAHLILPPLLQRLNRYGVPDADITILMALGTHRYMTEAEMEAKVGAAVYKRVRTVNHLWQDKANLADLGRTGQGTPLTVNRLLTESDVIIALGAIVPHHIPGYSGGSKIIQPGVCGPETTAETHLLSCEGGGDSFLGQVDNLVRRDMDEMAAKVGLNAIFNVVLDHDGQALGVFFGHYQAAFRAGAKLSREVYGVPYRVEPDIVLVNSWPCEIDFWQAHKSMYPGQIMVKPGGVIIVTTPCPEGISPVHTDLIEFTAWSSRDIKEGYRAGKIKNGVAAALAIAWAQVREKAGVITYSPGLSLAEKQALGHTAAAGLDEAVAMALAEQGPNSVISVLTHAPDLLPILVPSMAGHGAGGRAG